MFWYKKIKLYAKLIKLKALIGFDLLKTKQDLTTKSLSSKILTQHIITSYSPLISLLENKMLYIHIEHLILSSILENQNSLYILQPTLTCKKEDGTVITSTLKKFSILPSTIDTVIPRLKTQLETVSSHYNIKSLQQIELVLSKYSL